MTQAPIDICTNIEHEKKRSYNDLFGVILVSIFPHLDWILRVSPYSVQMRENKDQNNSEYGHFLRSGGSIWRECNTFYLRLSQLIFEKRNLSKSKTMNWIRTRVCFALLKSSLLCLQRSRTVCRKVSEFECDIDVWHVRVTHQCHIWIIMHVTCFNIFIYIKRLIHIESRQLILHCISIDWVPYEWL